MIQDTSCSCQEARNQRLSPDIDHRITLRQYPKVAGKPVVANRAKIEIAGQTLEQPVEQGSAGVVFEIDLPAGPTELVTYLYDEKGKAGGAYFTEVEAL